MEVKDHLIDPESVQLLPHLFSLTNGVVVLGKVDKQSKDTITIGMVDPGDLVVLDHLNRKFSPRKVEIVPLSTQEASRAQNMGYGLGQLLVEHDDAQRLDADHTGRRAPPKPIDEPHLELSRDVGGFSRIRGLEPVGYLDQEERPIIELVNHLLLDGLRRGATDIHLENFRKEVMIRYKIDGMLYRIDTPINKENVEEVISRFKVMSELDISEHRSPQDGRILLRTLRNREDYDVPFRVSILPGPAGEDVVLRVLDKSMAPIDLELLGFTSDDLVNYRKLVNSPQGFILVTGPTGSGKTTTLYATLKEIKTPYNKILSAEDPIEYTLDYVNQKQISGKLGFADLARAFLRHDPDILLIGEIRDVDTADVALKAATTGHLILSTLHTNDSIGSIPRLRSLGIEPNMIASCLIGVLSQRLVRKICTNCVEPYQPDPTHLAMLERHLGPVEFKRGKGCSLCNNTGYKGRTGLFELLIIDSDLSKKIVVNASMDEMLETAVESGMRPLMRDGLLKVEQGITTIEELFRVIPVRQITAQLDGKYEVY
ncbi:MAG: GspE/PulE family protein [Candidatus Alcyoniella australis]|nr:GspE/PulE family protein [Candidatus Alcyoniella australis]